MVNSIPRKDTKFVWTIIIIIVLALFLTVFSGFIGFGKGGFNQKIIFEQFTVYGWLGIGGLFIVFLLAFLEQILKRGESKYGSGLNFSSVGEPPSIPIKSLKGKVFKPLLIVAIFASIAGLLAVFTQQTYLGVGTLEQGFTFVDGILYNWLLVVTSENLVAFALSASVVFVLRRFAIKKDWGKWNLILLSVFFTILIFMTVGFINHQLRYANSEESLQKVLGFWFVNGAVTAVLGFLAGWVLHGINNTYVELANNFANEQILPYAIGVIVLLSLLFFFVYVWKGRKKTL